MDPNSLNEVMQEINHLHADIKQLGEIMIIAAFIIICWMPSGCKYKKK